MKNNPINRIDPLGLESKDEWRDKAYKEAGIDPKGWDLEKGYKANRENIRKAYEFYAKKFEGSDGKMKWAGLAKMAGARVMSGLDKLEDMRSAPSLDGSGNAMSLPAKMMQQKFMEMQKAVFDDMAWQHQAYSEKGLAELAQRAATGEMKAENYEAWDKINSGKTSEGNNGLLAREQKQILQPYWDSMGLLNGQMSKEALSPVPGGKSFNEYNPGGNITNFQDRWGWISKDMMPAWDSKNFNQQKALVGTPMSQLIEQNAWRDDNK